MSCTHIPTYQFMTHQPSAFRNPFIHCNSLFIPLNQVKMVDWRIYIIFSPCESEGNMCHVRCIVKLSLCISCILFHKLMLNESPFASFVINDNGMSKMLAPNPLLVKNNVLFWICRDLLL